MIWDYRIEEDAKRQLRDLGRSAASEILGYLDSQKLPLDELTNNAPIPSVCLLQTIELAFTRLTQLHLPQGICVSGDFQVRALGLH